MALAFKAFNEAWYRAKYPDVAAAIAKGQFTSGAQHYELFGAAEGRDPTQAFDTVGYIRDNADVAKAGINPFFHYETIGYLEGRSDGTKFDENYYLQNNPDVKASTFAGVDHFTLFGDKEGRNPHAGFNNAKYLQDNPDVKAAGMGGYFHYLLFGQKEGRVAYDVAGNVINGTPTVPQQGVSQQLFMTSGADIAPQFVATTGNDQAIANLVQSPEGAILNTLNNADIVDFKNGNDSLTATIYAPATLANGGVNNEVNTLPFGPRPTLTSLENIILAPQIGAGATAANLDFGAVTGLSKLSFTSPNGNATPLVINNIQANLTAPVTVTNPNNFGGATLLFADSALSGTTDAIGLTFDNATGNNGVFGAYALGSQAGTTGFETVNIISQGPTGVTNTFSVNASNGATQAQTWNATINHATSMTLTGSGFADTLNLVANAATSATLNSLETVKASGASNVSLTTNGTTSLDASAMSGALSVTFNDSVVTATGGSGNDNFTFSGNTFNSGAGRDSIIGGAGTDNLFITDNDLANRVTVAQTQLSGLEGLTITDQMNNSNGRFDFFNSAGILNFTLANGAGGGGADGVTFSAPVVTLTMTGNADDNFTVSMSTGAQTDVLNLVLGSSAGFAGTLTLSDVEQANITSGGTGSHTITGAITATAHSGTNTPFTVSGAQNLILNGTVNLSSLDASAMTGNLVMGAVDVNKLATVGAVSTIGINLQGGSGNDVLVGTVNGGSTSNNDTIVGGAGNDTIYASVSTAAAGSSQGDTLTGGTGNDVFAFASNNLANTLKISTGTTTGVTITDFVAGTDKIALVGTGAGSFVLENSQVIATAANLTDVFAGITALPAQATNELHGTIVTVLAGAASGTYLYIDDVAGTGAVNNAADMLIKLGLTGTFSANDIQFTA